MLTLLGDVSVECMLSCTTEQKKTKTNADFKFIVNRIGGVQAVLMLNGKRTRVELYLPEPTRARAWTILMEPLAISPDEQF